MKLNSAFIKNLAISTITMTALTAFSTLTFADNREALKDAIGFSVKMADAKPAEKIDIPKPPTSKTNEIINAEFKKLDADKNEKLSLKEAAKDESLLKQFNEVDINHDSVLSADEYTYYKMALTNKTNEELPVLN
ncbi:MAG: hypothetical protein ACXW1T_10240 [Methylophilus sp.]